MIAKKQSGDRIVYQKTSFRSPTTGNLTPGAIKSGIVAEVFASMDGSTWCYWVDGEPELITDMQVIE